MLSPVDLLRPGKEWQFSLKGGGEGHDAASVFRCFAENSVLYENSLKVHCSQLSRTGFCTKNRT